MKSMSLLAAILFLTVVLVGCEWGGTTEDVNGPYPNPTPTGTPNPNPTPTGTPNPNPTPTPAPGSQVTINGERLATGNSSATRYSGSFAHRPLLAGSVSIDAGGFHFSDDGDGHLSGSDGKEGQVAYSTGTWWIDLGVDVIPGSAIIGSYVYVTSN